MKISSLNSQKLLLLEEVLLSIYVLSLFCSEVRFSFPETALSAHPWVSSAQSVVFVCSWLSLFLLLNGQLISFQQFLFFKKKKLTQNGCRCGKHMLKVVEYYFHPEKRPDISSFRLCEFLISRWPSDTTSAASDNRNQ